MDNQPPLDPNQPARTPPDGFQPRANPAQSPPPRPYFSPPPGYQAGSPLDARPGYTPIPQPQILPQPVAPGQQPYFPPTPQPVQQQPLPLALPGKRRKFRWLRVLLGALGLAILAVVVLFVLRMVQAEPTKAAQKVSDQFISDLQKNDSLDAYSLTSKSYQQHTSSPNFEKIVTQVSGGLQGPVSIANRKATKSTPPQATLVYKIPTQYAVQYLKVDLEGGDSWQVTGFSASTISP